MSLCISNEQHRTLEELRQIPISPKGDRSDRWFGVQHGQLVDTIFNESDKLGLKVKDAQFGVSEDDADLFGDILFDNNRFIGNAPDGTGYELGFRHSNLGRYSITMYAGLKVFICANGLIFSEYQVTRRKHTTGLEYFLADEIKRGLLNFLTQLKMNDNFVNSLKTTAATDNRVNRLLTEIGRAEILPWSHIGFVDKNYHEENINVPEFKDRNLFSVYNSFTEIIKRRNPAEQHRTIARLKPFFDKEIA